MPSAPLTTRVPPVVHDRLVEMATRRGTSLAATAAAVLAAAVETGDEGAGPQPDGTLVAAVRALLEDVTAPKQCCTGRSPCGWHASLRGTSAEPSPPSC